ncbi:hypothetical protein COMNV_00489 [Commensalibacter sp. Nvir]|uniref:hypothetical protein n=1 Tax=Commensalibacter sp. Nvir TaxID=3069817 RepID=UPI002D6EBF46|nr:hypothetical protein COMNV_00489 [Commensalibacter sp. Nvir]
MKLSAFINLEDVRNQKPASKDFIDKAAFVACNVPVAFSIIYNLMENLKNDLEEEEIFNGSVEIFLFQLRYMLQAVETNANKLRKTLIDSGYRDFLSYQD